MDAPSQQLVGIRLPNSQTRALGVLALFVSVQLADGCMTALGIERFGIAAEANRILALAATFLGPAAALTIAKAVAIVSAVVLYRLSRHFLLALLTLMYVFVAIVPWAWALSIS